MCTALPRCLASISPGHATECRSSLTVSSVELWEGPRTSGATRVDGVLRPSCVASPVDRSCSRFPPSPPSASGVRSCCFLLCCLKVLSVRPGRIPPYCPRVLGVRPSRFLPCFPRVLGVRPSDALAIRPAGAISALPPSQRG